MSSACPNFRDRKGNSTNLLENEDCEYELLGLIEGVELNWLVVTPPDDDVLDSLTRIESA